MRNSESAFSRFVPPRINETRAGCAHVALQRAKQARVLDSTLAAIEFVMTEIHPDYVAIIVPTYNRAALLPRAIDSVIAQTCSHWKLIVVDDGSIDDTQAVLARYREQIGERLHVIVQPHTGCCAARNRGLDAADCPFVAFLDSDDEFLPHKLERLLELFRLRPELGMVFSDSSCTDERGIRHTSVLTNFAPHARLVPKTHLAENLWTCGVELFDHLLHEYFISTIGGMVRKQVLDTGIRFQNDPAYAEEWLFCLQIARICRVGFVDEPLNLHHHTPGSISRTDARRNVAGRAQTLRLMLTTLAELNSRQKRIIRQNLARACDQLAFDAIRAGEIAQSVKHFFESLRNDFQMRTFVRWVGTCWQARFGARSGSSRESHSLSLGGSGNP